MYGLLMENLAAFVRTLWGEGKWEEVRKHARVDAPSFSIHHVYAETLLARLGRSATQVLGVEERQFFEAMGVFFVEFVGHYGYDQILTVLGRQLRDFFNGLDNLHEYLKFSYPKMRAPSFYCDEETATGLQLHYRSKRRGFVWYTMGQIKQVAKHFYGQDIQIELVSEELDGEAMHYIYQLTFDNHAFVEHECLRTLMKKESQLPIRASILFELFPFCVVFSTKMEIQYTGHALMTILKHLKGQGMTQAFELVRPLITFSFQTIVERSNNTFELQTISPIKEDILAVSDEEGEEFHLKLRGQMLFMEEWDMILFLASPVMPNLESLVGAGIFINDLSLHDCCRDLVLAETQQSVELKLALDQEQLKSRKLEESMRKLDEEMGRTDQLLYQMIPMQIADRLRRGESPVQTCEVVEEVTILFSDVVTFTQICSQISPFQVVRMLNHMYSLFDQLTERNGVYKVETIGDSYMVICGAPVMEPNHAEKIADMAMDMMDAATAIKDPTGVAEGESGHLKLRVGVHSGMVVAGVVGVKMPRYCLFGETVILASRMESGSKPSRIQISEETKSRLGQSYKLEKREATWEEDEEGEISTYWLVGREARVTLTKDTPGLVWAEPGESQQSQTERHYDQKAEQGSRKNSSFTSGEATEQAKTRDEIVSRILIRQPSTSAEEEEEMRRKLTKAARAVQRAPLIVVKSPPGGRDYASSRTLMEDKVGKWMNSEGGPTSSRGNVSAVFTNPGTSRPLEWDRQSTGHRSGAKYSPTKEEESLQVKFKMKEHPHSRKGSEGRLGATLSEIGEGLDRIPKNERIRKRLRENRVVVRAADVLEDLGCLTFADEHRQVVSRVCSIL